MPHAIVYGTDFAPGMVDMIRCVRAGTTKVKVDFIALYMISPPIAGRGSPHDIYVQQNPFEALRNTYVVCRNAIRRIGSTCLQLALHEITKSVYFAQLVDARVHDEQHGDHDGKETMQGGWNHESQGSDRRRTRAVWFCRCHCRCSDLLVGARIHARSPESHKGKSKIPVIVLRGILSETRTLKRVSTSCFKAVLDAAPRACGLEGESVVNKKAVTIHTPSEQIELHPEISQCSRHPPRFIG